MLHHSDTIHHHIFTPVIYEISNLNLTLLPTEVQQHISLAPELTRISQADTTNNSDGNMATYWLLYDASSQLPTHYFEGPHVAANFLADCLL